MKDWTFGRLAFVDVETTGLDPARDVLLEVGLILTDANLRELGRAAWTVSWRWAQLLPVLFREGRDQEDSVMLYGMHSANGLLAECELGGHPLAEIDAQLRALIEQDYDEERDGKILLCGCSPWLDRSMVQLHLPRTAELLHHRTLDVSSLKAALVNWGGAELAPRESKPHRALPDCEAALDLARQARRFLSAALVGVA